MVGEHILDIDLKFSVSGVEIYVTMFICKPQTHRIGGFVFNISLRAKKINQNTPNWILLTPTVI